MPTEERTTKGAERCATHPSRLTVGRCDVCGRPLCVECAVPVRGRVLGAECLPEVLGSDLPATEPPRPWRSLRSPVDRVIGAAFAVAALATLLPWTRFSTGSGFAGGVGVRRPVVDARGTRGGGRPRCLGRVRTASLDDATGGVDLWTAGRRGVAVRDPQPSAVHEASPGTVDRLGRGGRRDRRRRCSRAPGLHPHMFDSPLSRGFNRAGHGALDAPRIMCARKETGWRSREAST